MKKLLIALISTAALSAGVSQVMGDHHLPMMAVADLQPAPGNPVSGRVTFSQNGNRVTVVADIRGLPPNTTHGFHIHEKGDCTPPDFASAGGHFNPGGHPHAAPGTSTRHAGDLGNLEAGANGRAYRRIIVDNITLGSGANSVMGRGVIVHERRDDLTSQPSGDAGGRIACGTIRVVDSSQSTDRN
jgi:superoxide dismutase, Cu-Zn family